MSSALKKFLFACLLTYFVVTGVIFAKYWPQKSEKSNQNVFVDQDGYVKWNITGIGAQKSKLTVSHILSSKKGNEVNVFEMVFPKKLTIFSEAPLVPSLFGDISSSKGLLTLSEQSDDPALKGTWLDSAVLGIYIHRDSKSLQRCSNPVAEERYSTNISSTTINSQVFYSFGEVGGGMEYVNPITSYFTNYQNTCVEFVFSLTERKYPKGFKDASRVKKEFEDILKTVIFYRNTD